MSVEIVILAAGQGTRMYSDLPKVLQPLAGRPMLAHVIDAAEAAGCEGVHVVYGFGGDEVQAAMGHRPVFWAHQAEQLGTGHAVAQALPGIQDEQIVVVAYGDVPLIRPETLSRLAEKATPDALVILTAVIDDPAGYGRIIRDADGQVTRIVEQKDASPEEQEIREINTGLVAAPASRLRDWLSRVGNDNSQGEYYLTDIAELAVADGVPVFAERANSAAEVAGINDRSQLATAEASIRRRRAEALMSQGCTLADPARIDIRGPLVSGRDVFVDVGVVFEGRVELGDRVRIGPYCVLRDAIVEADTTILPHSLIEQSHIGPSCNIGPFARLRPGTRLAARAKVGNFVEIKNTELGEGSKANHLSYVGDAVVGKDVNIGAGTITCNYDGANKHRTVIGDRAFIGSGVELVAPVEVGEGATIGAGSTLGKDAPAEQLTVARARQVSISSWRRPVKKKD
ncbi:MAG: bifunctional UDP-N-acetylglucosamine diphosphorylase/glucosamine-1-phosphate N-acetyltransferase GlmU [Gammaproteobacteria bacterium]